MPYVDKRLLKASKDRTTIKLEDGESFTGTYLGYEPKVDQRYGKMRYCFRFMIDGVSKELRTNAKKFLEKMAYIPVNAILEITRRGETTDTDYNIKIIKKPKDSPIGGGEEVEAPVETEEEEVEETQEVVEEPDEDEVDISKVPF